MKVEHGIYYYDYRICTMITICSSDVQVQMIGNTGDKRNKNLDFAVPLQIFTKLTVAEPCKPNV